MPNRSDLCFATTNRQAALKAIAGRADVVVVIGSVNSSNTRALEKVARASGCPRVLRVNAADELPDDLSGTVGVTAGASAPDELVDAVARPAGPRRRRWRRSASPTRTSTSPRPPRLRDLLGGLGAALALGLGAPPPDRAPAAAAAGSRSRCRDRRPASTTSGSWPATATSRPPTSSPVWRGEPHLRRRPRPPALRVCATTAGRWVVAVTVLGSSMAAIDSTVVGIALPAIGRNFSLSVSSLQWVVSAYLLALAGLLLVGGALGDRYGRRRVFLVGVVCFALTSLVCAVAPDAAVLIAGRALQGVGAALLTPGSLAILRASFAPDDQGRAVGAWSGLGGVATAIGPFLGGFLISAVSWRLIFLINLPIAVVVVVMGARHVPETTDPDATGRVDIAGAVLVSGRPRRPHRRHHRGAQPRLGVGPGARRPRSAVLASSGPSSSSRAAPGSRCFPWRIFRSAAVHRHQRRHLPRLRRARRGALPPPHRARAGGPLLPSRGRAPRCCPSRPSCSSSRRARERSPPASAPACR